MQPIKHFVKLFMPPILLEAWRGLRHKPSYRGPLTDDEVRILARGDVFCSAAWLDYTRRKLAVIDPQQREGHLTIHRFLLGTLLSLLCFRATVTVVDFGGGAGELYRGVTAQVEQPENVRYIVVDKAPLIALGQTMLPGVLFVDSDKPADHAPLRSADLLFASSVLQYVQDWQGFLKYIAALKPRLFVLCRHLSPDNLAEPLPAAQMLHTEAGFAGETLLHLINWRLVAEIMQQNGYRLVSTLVNDEPPVFGPERDKEYGITERLLVFESTEHTA